MNDSPGQLPATAVALKREARPAAPVRVSMPASVAYNLNEFQRGIGSIMNEVGCPRCCSGFDITFGMEREFIMNENLELRTAHSMPAVTGDPMPAAPTVSVTVPASVSYNLEAVQQVVARVASRLGCAPCSSGFDLRFRQELDFFVDANLNVHATVTGY